MATATSKSIKDWILRFAVGRKPQWTLVRILILVGTVFVLLKYVLMVRKIESTSMLPTLPEGSIHVFNRLAYSANHPPQRGDIVAVRTSGETILYVKRIIGLPGESIEIRSGTVVVNNQALDEPYVRLTRRHPPFWKYPLKPPSPRRLGDDEYFLIGDNRAMPQELHDFGSVHVNRIAAKLIR